jgi:hypothetical protein
VRPFPRTCVAICAVLIGGCGHLAFEELPLGESEAGIDAGGGDGAIDAALPDGSDDATSQSDATDASDAADGADGGCSGASCVGTFVSGNTGSDTNPGTPALPVKTITRAIAIAVTLGGKQSVFVAAAHYPEKITLTEGVDLLGGFDCDVGSCTWARNVVLNDTAILAQDFEGVLAPKTVTRQTLFDGFRVMGKAGAPLLAPGSAAITLDGGTPTISRCRIVGGDTSGGASSASRRSIAVAVLAPSNATGALLDRNSIVGGASAEWSTGVLFDSRVGTLGGPAVAVLRGNAIHGGTAPSTSAVAAFASGSATLVQGNDITAGTSNVVGANPGSSWGIMVASAMTIDGNRINTDAANVGTCNANGSFCGGIESLSSTTIITNNVVLGVKGPRTSAVLLTEAEQAAGVVVLNANTLDGAGSGIGISPTLSTAIAVRIGNCSACGTNAVIGKARNNILLGGTNATRYGVFEEGVTGKSSHLSALDNNDFWNATATARNDFAYHLWDGSSNTATDLTFGQLTSLTTPVPSGDFNLDPLLDSAYRLTSASPCIDKGTALEAPPRDIDDDVRPKGAAVDVGADESK